MEIYRDEISSIETQSQTGTISDGDAKERKAKAWKILWEKVRSLTGQL
jgi:hypothetical protein